VVTFQGRRVFAVDGSGVWVEVDHLVAFGTVDSGLIGYGLSDAKTALYLTTQMLAGAGSFQSYVAVDGGDFNLVGRLAAPTSPGAATDTTTSVGQLVGDLFEVRHTLNRDLDDSTLGPVLGRFTLRSDPRASRRVQITVPLLLAPRLTNLNDEEFFMDIDFERAQIRAWNESRQILIYQEGASRYPVVIEDYQWMPYMTQGSPTYGISGTLLTLLKTA
jgi:hypothetical protein